MLGNKLLMDRKPCVPTAQRGRRFDVLVQSVNVYSMCSFTAAPGGQIKYGIQPKAVWDLDFTCRKSSCQLEARA